MRPRPRQLLLATLALLLGASVAGAAPTLEAVAGYERLYSPVRPVPLRVAIHLPAGEAPFKGALLLEAWQEEGGAPRCIHAYQDVELGPGSAKRYLFSFRPDRSKGVRLRLVDAKGVIQAEQVFAYGVELLEMPPGVPLVGTLRAKEGRTPLYWPTTFAHRKAKDRSSPSGAVAVEVSPELLLPGGLEGLSALVLAEGPSLEPEQLETLERWIREGGQLLVAPGLRPLDGDHPLSPLLPMVARSQRRVRGAVTSFEEGGGDGSASLITGRLTPGTWIGHAAPDGTPVLVTRALGRGRVALLTAGLKDRALGPETVRAGLFARAFVLPSLQPRGAGRIDVLEQSTLQANLKSSESAVDRSWIALLILAFLLVVGPLDYLLWRWRPGPRMTWVTLTVSSLGFSALAFAVGTSGTGPGLATRSTWIVDCFEDGSAVVDGMVVLAGRRHASFAITAPAGVSLYPSGTPESGEARLQGDLLFTPTSLRFNLGLGARLPLRARGVMPQAPNPPIAVSWKGPGRIGIKWVGETSLVGVMVVTGKGQKRIGRTAGELEVSLDSIEDDGQATQMWVDDEGLVKAQHNAGLWATAARRLAAACESGAFSDEPVDAVGWGLERSAWLERGHVVVIAEVRGAPDILAGKDIEPRKDRGRTFFRFHLTPPTESDPPRAEGWDSEGDSEDAKSDSEDDAKNDSEDAKSDSEDAKSDSEDAKSDSEDAQSDSEQDAKSDAEHEGLKSSADPVPSASPSPITAPTPARERGKTE